MAPTSTISTSKPERRGIILAGGTGTRLYPTTLGTCKQLLPIYDKPLIYYPLSVLMLADIREVLVITTPDDQGLFRRVLGDGSQWGLKLAYAAQPRPDGLAQAFIIGESFLQGHPSALVLGDNILYGGGVQSLLARAGKASEGATIFGYRVSNPEDFGVAELDEQGKVVDIEEKPRHPKSNYAVTGLYFYDARATAFAKSLEPSARGELEITDLNRCYLQQGALDMVLLGRGVAWLDTGTPEALMNASSFIYTLQKRQGLQVACPEEIAFVKGWISADQLASLARPLEKTGYGRYLLDLLQQGPTPNTPPSSGSEV